MTDGAANHFGSISFIQELAVSEDFSAIFAVKKLAKTKLGLSPAFSGYARAFALRASHNKVI